MPLWTLYHISKLVRYSILLKDQAITNLSVFISLYVTETNSGILVSFDESWLGIMLYIFLSIVMCLSYLSSRFSALHKAKITLHILRGSGYVFSNLFGFERKSFWSQVVEAKVHQLDFTLERIFLSLKEIMVTNNFFWLLYV